MLNTNHGPLFVKSYHPERYQPYVPAIWDEIGQALRLQMKFYYSGGPCPGLYANGVDDWLFEAPGGRKFVVMEHRPGRIVSAGRVREAQMYSLGLAASGMHNAWNAEDGSTNGSTPPSSGKPVWTLDKNEMLETWNRIWEEAGSSAPSTRSALLLQREIIDRVDPDEYQHAAPGWTHLDLWVDNLLFASDELTAIVDFDRVRYSYPILDIGRAILSCTLDAGRIRRDAASAFAEGYRKNRALPKGSLLTAVHYCWLVESFWWLRPGMEAYSTAPQRFAEEMLWTASGWDALAGELGDI